MKSYFVAWYIDIDADSPEDAARQALAIQRDPKSVATVFDVKHAGASVVIDVEYLDQEEE